ncbi:MAG: nucleoside triphosphate pyrophosphohydrolase [Candidatus Obscuribacterales bacterium]|nr:nucleoside triphosphate pyrophosphohydrolase [Steroidobacteraceae bacterium]
MSIERLLAIMSRLRDPARGCPWDREQSFATIAPYTIEEAYEVADAIERKNLTDLKSELGDLLFQVVFHSRLADEQGAFNFDDVVRTISEKLERRHPHVFANASIATAEDQNLAWEEHKRQERAARNQQASVLDEVPLGMPALTRAAKLGKRASSVGFDWPNLNGVLDKIDEEVHELRDAIDIQSHAEITAELGDVLFSIANLGRHLRVDLESALRATNAKFERRFRYVEAQLAALGKTPQQSTLAEMDRFWEEAKGREGL